MKTNDRKSVQNAKTRENSERKAELEAIRFVMRDPIGRRFMQRLIDATGADREPAFQPNAMTLAHDAGVRRLGFFLLQEIRTARPEQEVVMGPDTLRAAQRADTQEEFENDD